MSQTPQQDVIDAVLYAMKYGCFHPVPQPTSPYTVRKMIKWGAMRNLHEAVAKLTKAEGGAPPARGQG